MAKDPDSFEEVYAMAKLPPRLTGLPMTVWIRPNEGFPHDLRVKVSRTHGRGCWPYVASVAVRPQPREIARQSDDGRFRGRRPLDRSQSGGDRRLLGRAIDIYEVLQRLARLP